MNTNNRRVLGVHLQDGIVQRVSSDDPEIEDAAVVVYDDGNVQRAIFAERDDGETRAAAPEAIDSTRCHGIGIACDLAGERLLALGRKKFDGTQQAIDDVVSVIEELHRMVLAAFRLESVAE